MTFEECLKKNQEYFNRVTMIRFTANYFKVPIDIAESYLRTIEDIRDKDKIEARMAYERFIQRTVDFFERVFHECDGNEEETLKRVMEN